MTQQRKGPALQRKVTRLGYLVPTTQLGVVVPKTLQAKIRERAFEERRTMGEIVNEAINLYLDGKLPHPEDYGIDTYVMLDPKLFVLLNEVARQAGVPLREVLRGGAKLYHEQPHLIAMRKAASKALMNANKKAADAAIELKKQQRHAEWERKIQEQGYSTSIDMSPLDEVEGHQPPTPQLSAPPSPVSSLRGGALFPEDFTLDTDIPDAETTSK